MIERHAWYDSPMAKTSLTGINGPTEVRLAVRVTSPATRTSPLTGMTAVAFEWAFFVSHMQRTVRRGQEHEERAATLLERVVDLGPIEVETLDGAARIPITAGDARLDFTVEGEGVTLDRALPPQMAHVMNSSIAQEGVVSYHESSLTTGSVVELRAHVAPSVDAQGNTTFRVCPELGTILLVDQEPDFGRKRRKVVPIALGALLVAGFFAYAVIKDPRFTTQWKHTALKGHTEQSAAPAPLASECDELRDYLAKLPCVDDLDDDLVAHFCNARPGCPAATRHINHCRIAHGEPHCTPDGALVSLMPSECLTYVSPSEPLKAPDRAAICAAAGEPFTP